MQPVTISSPEKAKFAKSLGADYCINYTKTDFAQATLDWTDGAGVDVVFDTVGGDTFCRSIAATKIYGKIVTLLEPPCDISFIKMAKFRNLSLIYELMLTPMLQKMHQARINQRMMLESNLIAGLQVKISQTLPLEQIAEAHKLIEAGNTLGKIVLTI